MGQIMNEAQPPDLHAAVVDLHRPWHALEGHGPLVAPKQQGQATVVADPCACCRRRLRLLPRHVSGQEAACLGLVRQAGGPAHELAAVRHAARRGADATAGNHISRRVQASLWQG